MRLIKFTARLTSLALLLGLGACAEPGSAEGAAGGYAVFKKAYDLEKAPKLALDLGNLFTETPEGYLTKGQAPVDCMNSVPYAALSLGPEDLALAPKDLEKLVKTAGFPVIASNLYLKTGKKPDFIKSQQVIAA